MKLTRCTGLCISGIFRWFIFRSYSDVVAKLTCFYFRFLTQKKYTDLLNMLNKGSTLLLQHDQQGSGADLAILLVDVLTKSDIDTREEWIEKLAKLFELMSSSIPEREQFLTNSVKWSMNNSKKGHPLLHQVIIVIKNLK